MTTPKAQFQSFDHYVLQCWADRAHFQRAAFEAFAAYLD